MFSNPDPNFDPNSNPNRNFDPNFDPNSNPSRNLDPNPDPNFRRFVHLSTQRTFIRISKKDCILYNLERRYVIGILPVPATIEFVSVHSPAVDCKVAATPPTV